MPPGAEPGRSSCQETVLPKPTDGVPRPSADRSRPSARRLSTISRVNRRSVAIAYAAQDALHHRTGGTAALAAAAGRGLRPLATTDRALPILVATLA